MSKKITLEPRERGRINEQNSVRNIIHGGSGTGGGAHESAMYFGPNTPINSLAFGSTQPRNIDLTRPLVTPVSNNRPKSEIITGTLPFNQNQLNDSIDSGSTHHSVYAKDDANYRNNNNQRNGHNSASVQPVQEPLMASKQHSQLQMGFGSGMSFFRAVRRHDPELVPAKQKYLFREYGAPSRWSSGFGSSSSGLKKENSMMTCSMTSAKSFQTKQLGKQPKKSYSMNRLDQLAQPRKRPITATFIKGKTNVSGPGAAVGNCSRSSKDDSATATAAERLSVKPTPPPKNFTTPTLNNKSKVPNSKEMPTRSSEKKQRPLSQIELKSDSAVFESPFNDKQMNKEEDADKLAEYKKQLAEKRAQYRKMQEQKLNQIVKSKSPNDDNNNNNKDDKTNEDDGKKSSDENSIIKITPNKLTKTAVVNPRRPRSTIIESSVTKSLADETKEALEKEQNLIDLKQIPKLDIEQSDMNKLDSNKSKDSSSSSSSSSTSSTSSPSSSSDSSFENKPEPENSGEKNILLNKTNDELIEKMNEFSINESAANQICDDSVINKSQQQPGNIMTTSFDSSLLHSNSPAAMLVNLQQQTASPIQLNSSSSLTQEQIEERQQEIMKQHVMERQKRKSRIQEILKGRTRKDDQKMNNENVKNINDDDVDDNNSKIFETATNIAAASGASPGAGQSSTDNSLEQQLNINNNIDINDNNLMNNQKTLMANGNTANGHYTNEETLIQLTNTDDNNSTFVKTNGVHESLITTE